MNEWRTVEFGVFPSSQRRGGCAERSEGADGVVSSAKHFAELTTPAAPIRKGNFFLLVRPPLLCEEGNAPVQFIYTLPSRAKRMLGFVRFGQLAGYRNECSE